MSDYNEEVSRKSRKTAMILNLLFGGVGAHDFYLGKKGAGFGHICLCVLFEIFYIFAMFGDYSSSSAVYLAYLVMIPNNIWTIVEFVKIVSGNMRDSEYKPVKLWNPEEYDESYFSSQSSAQENSSSESIVKSASSASFENNAVEPSEDGRWTCRKCGNIMNQKEDEVCTICGEKKPE